MEQEILNKYNVWKINVKEDIDLINELENMSDDDIFEAFYKELSFGTAGIRGILGAGTNRMNIFIIRRVSQALANYLKDKFVNQKDKKINVAIAYDSRIKSLDFAKEAAKVLASNNIHVYLYDKIMPVPVLSFTIRELKCDAGIVVTASHNPSKYNGYKVYGSDGCQITTNVADKITLEIGKIDLFSVLTNDFESLIKSGLIEYVNDEVFSKFLEKVKACSVLGEEIIDKNVSIIYSPLNGTGLVPVTTILKSCGFNNVKVVKEQELPDGNFPTCPYPNPEIKEAMELGIRDAKKYNADLLIATDPDCDRCGIAVKDGNNYKLLSGNQTGILLFNYICELRNKNHTMPTNPKAIKTIVSTALVDEIAKFYNVEVTNCLTGFKYIGDFITSLENKNDENSYIFGFEESYGYLTGTHCRDKDAVNASFMIAEMFAYYKSHGISLIEKLNELYNKFGFFVNKLNSYTFEGAKGLDKMNLISKNFKENVNKFGDLKVKEKIDYSLGVGNLPKSDVIKFILEDGSSIIARPSGTEPKYKIYFEVKAKTMLQGNEILNKLEQIINEIMK